MVVAPAVHNSHSSLTCPFQPLSLHRSRSIPPAIKHPQKTTTAISATTDVSKFFGIALPIGLSCLGLFLMLLIKLFESSDTMEILTGKWKVSIIACLCYQPMRYSELLKEVKGISGKMLSRELKDLEMNQLIERNVLNTAPVAVEYRITEYGNRLNN